MKVQDNYVEQGEKGHGVDREDGGGGGAVGNGNAHLVILK